MSLSLKMMVRFPHVQGPSKIFRLVNDWFASALRKLSKIFASSKCTISVLSWKVLQVFNKWHPDSIDHHFFTEGDVRLINGFIKVDK